MKAEDYFIYIPSSKLVSGLYVDLELAWIDHPFAFSRFRIKTDKEIATIQRLKPTRVKIYPGRSSEGILLPDLDEGEGDTVAAPAPEDSELEALLEQKRAQEERAAELRVRRRAVNREYREKSGQIRQLTADMKSRPANAIHDPDVPLGPCRLVLQSKVSYQELKIR